MQLQADVLSEKSSLEGREAGYVYTYTQVRCRVHSSEFKCSGDPYSAYQRGQEKAAPTPEFEANWQLCVGF
jgi:hypothetical protein